MSEVMNVGVMNVGQSSQKPFVWAVSYQNVQQVYVPKVFKNKIWYFIAAPDWLLHFAEALAGELDFEEALQRASQMTQGGSGWPWQEETFHSEKMEEFYIEALNPRQYQPGQHVLRCFLGS